jgi:hypothetical protein
MKIRLALGLVAVLVATAACGEQRSEGGLTADEERQLDNAAKMLDDNMVDASPDSLVADEAELDALERPATGGADDASANATEIANSVQ